MNRMISFLTWGNRKFEQLLMHNASNENLKQDKDYYNESCKRHDVNAFQDKLRYLSPSRLIENVANYELEIQQLREVIGGYKMDLKKVRNRNRELETLVNSATRIILGQKFDEVFRMQ